MDQRYYDNVIRVMKRQCSIEMGQPIACLLNLYHSKYDVIQDKGKCVVIKVKKKTNEPILRYVPIEETFDVLFAAHMVNNHNSRESMQMLIKESFVITDDLIDYFLMSCSVCTPFTELTELTVAIPQKPVYLAVLDMTKQDDNSFKYVFIYQESKTRFILLRPVLAKCHFEIGTELMKILTSFGPPDAFLVSQSDLTFFENVMTSVTKLGVNCDIALKVSDIEPTAYDYVETCLCEWMTETDTTNWGVGCIIVQWKLNISRVKLNVMKKRDGHENRYDDVIVPHICVFGCSPLCYVEEVKGYSDIKQKESNKTKVSKQTKKQQNVDSKPNEPKSPNQTNYDDNVVMVDDDELIPQVVPKNKINNNICHICECKINDVYICNLCKKSVHLFCSEISQGSDPNSPLHICFSCSNLMRL